MMTDNFYGFYAAQAKLDDFAPATLTGRGVYRFNASATTRIPLHVRTGQQSFGNPVERKRFTQVEFHGKGTVYCRVYVDGIWVIDAAATLTETPTKDRRIGIPVATKGYTMDLEFSGDADIRAVEFEYKPMAGSS